MRLLRQRIYRCVQFEDARVSGTPWSSKQFTFYADYSKTKADGTGNSFKKIIDYEYKQYESMNRWIKEWMNEWKDEWKDERIKGWMKEWMNMF